MDQPRMFFVAPDAIHLRLHYEPLTNTWTLHAAVVSHTAEGEVHSDPATPYRYMTNQEALDVAEATLRGALGL